MEMASSVMLLDKIGIALANNAIASFFGNSCLGLFDSIDGYVNAINALLDFYLLSCL